MVNGAKLGVAAVACATPLFLPRSKIMYTNMLHISAPPRKYLVCAPPVLSPDWRHWLLAIMFNQLVCLLQMSFQPLQLRIEAAI